MSVAKFLNTPVTNIFGRIIMALVCIICGLMMIIWIAFSTHRDKLQTVVMMRYPALKYDVIQITIGKNISYGICERYIIIQEAPLFNRWGAPTYIFKTKEQALRSWLELVDAIPDDPVHPVETYKIYKSITGEQYNH